MLEIIALGVGADLEDMAGWQVADGRRIIMSDL
jgi:hypothetical protein